MFIVFGLGLTSRSLTAVGIFFVPYSQPMLEFCDPDSCCAIDVASILFGGCAVDIDEATRKCIRSSPAAWNSLYLYPRDLLWGCRIYQEPVPNRLKAQQCSNE